MDVLSVYNLAKLYREKKLSPVEHTSEMFRRIKAKNKQLHAYIYLTEESAMNAARQAEKDFMSGNIRSQLQGITVGVKDLIWTEDAPVMLGCQYYYENPIQPVCDSTVVEKLRRSGAIILGKTNTHALAMGATGDDSWDGCACNPYDTSRITGGSSSGSAAAVAAGLCDISLGTDSGGSVRIPSACCGVVGMKPTFGRVSKFGVQALGLSCDCVGPLTNTVRDSAASLTLMIGGDTRDMYSIDSSYEDFTDYLDRDISDMTVAVPFNWIYNEPLDEDIKEATLHAIDALREIGVTIIDVSEKAGFSSRAALKNYRASHQTILSSDGYFLHQKALQQPEKISEQPLQRLYAGNISALERNQAYASREGLRAIYNDIFNIADILLTPSVAIPPSKLGQREVEMNGQKYSVYSLLSEFTWQGSFAGFPSMSLPSGMTKSGLPMGILLNARPLAEKNIYRLASALEKVMKNNSCVNNASDL